MIKPDVHNTRKITVKRGRLKNYGIFITVAAGLILKNKKIKIKMSVLNKYREDRELVIKKSLGKISDEEYLVKSGKGRWVTTEDGNRAFLGGDGKLAYTKEEISSKEEKGDKESISEKQNPMMEKKLEPFKALAKKHAGDVSGFMDAVRKVNNVPGAVSKYFSDVYGQKGELSMEQTAKVFMDIHGKK